MPKLNWEVAKDSKGKFVRRKLDDPNDALHWDHIDVTWTHDDGFPEDTVEVPVSHPPGPHGVPVKQEFKTVPHQQREEIKDQLIVPPETQDSTIMMMLDQKRPVLAKALGIAE